jgi:hypothetical protein
VTINWKAPGWIWLEHLGENVGWTFFNALAGAILAAGRLTAIDWPAALDVAGFAALIAILGGIGTRKVGRNGTDSLNPHVVAAPRKPNA